MTLWQLNAVAAWFLVALWTLYVLVLRHLESPAEGVPTTVELQETAAELGKDDTWVREMRSAWVTDTNESTLARWVGYLGSTVATPTQQDIVREMRLHGRLLRKFRRAKGEDAEPAPVKVRARGWLSAHLSPEFKAVIRRVLARIPGGAR